MRILSTSIPKAVLNNSKGVLKPNEFRGVELICENIKSTSFSFKLSKLTPLVKTYLIN